MQRYVRVSGMFFCLLAAVQLTRTLLGWPVQVAGVDIPVWPSVVAFLVTSTFAIWAFRSARAPSA
ncbi:MAG TPA: hypothetical protein VFU23_06510 [Gemmatimonadales bacterium]|nr:hypothetical protein [Gemmatimonadales bacterium]